jgi:hypothetical protein
MSDKLFKPGQKAPRSGQYEITGPRGGGTGGRITPEYANVDANLRGSK